MSSKIPYCNETLEVTGGCDKCSPGCQNCWAIREVWRMAHNPLLGDKWKDLVEKKNGVLNWTGKIKFFKEALTSKKLRGKNKTIFIDSKCDLFHPSVNIGLLTHIFDTIKQCPQHIIQILTKRPKQALKMMWGKHGEGWRYFGDGDFHKNIHFGVTVENQDNESRIDELRKIPAAVKFVSFEPLLGLIPNINLAGISWVVLGGESGPNARPMHPDWVRSVRDQCIAANVPFFFKQWGEWAPFEDDVDNYGSTWGNSAYNRSLKRLAKTHGASILLDDRPEGWDDIMLKQGCAVGKGLMIGRVGKKKAGCILDGREWKQYPKVR